MNFVSLVMSNNLAISMGISRYKLFRRRMGFNFIPFTFEPCPWFSVSYIKLKLYLKLL